MPKTMERENDIPAGFEKVGMGNLPRFFDLGEAGQYLVGYLRNVRTSIMTEKLRTKKGTEEIERRKYYFDIELKEAAEGEDASKDHNPVKHEAGDMITLSGSGTLVRSFTLAALRQMSQSEDSWPKGEEAPEVSWETLYGLEVYVRREKDGKMGLKSKFPGHKVKQYTVAFKGLVSAGK